MFAALAPGLLRRAVLWRLILALPRVSRLLSGSLGRWLPALTLFWLILTRRRWRHGDSSAGAGALSAYATIRPIMDRRAGAVRCFGARVSHRSAGASIRAQTDRY